MAESIWERGSKFIRLVAPHLALFAPGDTARREWHKKPASLIVLFVFVASLWWWEWHIPSPGEAVAAMAVAAALMAIFGEMGGKEKLAWTILLFGFLFLELTSIETERNASEALRASARAQEERNFSRIGDGIKLAVQQGAVEFDATMSKAQENLNHMTGGNSYPIAEIIPVPTTGTVSTFRITYSIAGKSPLFDVAGGVRKFPLPTQMNMTEMLTTGGADPSMLFNFAWSSFSPGRVEFLPVVTVSLAGQTDYQIHTLARNGIFNENLHIRRTGDVPIQTKNGVEPPWEQSWEITRNFKIIKRSKWHKFVAMNTKATPQ